MIHINNGENEHSWLTSEEFSKIHGKEEFKRDYTLQKSRVSERIKLRDLSKFSGISVVDLSRIERGGGNHAEIKNYIDQINKFKMQKLSKLNRRITW